MFLFFFLTIVTVSITTADDGDIHRVGKGADPLFKQMRDYVIDDNLDPYHIDDIYLGISKTLAFITYRGGITLYNGFLEGISNMQRDGDVIIDLSNGAVAKFTIRFNELTAYYNYKVKIWNIGPSGMIVANIKAPVMVLYAAVDVNYLNVTVLDYNFVQTGEIKLDFKGHILFDWLLDLIGNTVTSVLHDKILQVAKQVFFQQVVKLVAKIDEYVIKNPKAAMALAMHIIGM